MSITTDCIKGNLRKLVEYTNRINAEVEELKKGRVEHLAKIKELEDRVEAIEDDRREERLERSERD